MKKVILVALVLMLVVGQVSALLEARIGNSRMVLRAETGEVVERSILVINSNAVPVTIEMFASGDLADNVVLRDDGFVLQPGEEKKAYFTIVADEEGTSETKINVKFNANEESGIGFSSNVILIASGETVDGSFEELGYEDDGEGGDDSEGMSTPMILFISTIVLIVILVVLIVYASRKKGKKVGRRRG